MSNATLIRTVFRYLLLLAVIAFPVAAQSMKDKDLAKKMNDDADKAVSAKKYPEAIALYEKSLTLQPSNSIAHYRKGFVHFNLEENDLAVNEFTIALAQGYKPLDIYRIRYSAYLRQNNYDAALADVKKGLAIVPNDLTLLNAVGEINYARGSYPEALAAYQKSLQISPNNADIYNHLARVNSALGDSMAQAAAAETTLKLGS
ncbi:MAG: tetratricopeptide repeat protein, partial [Pyrinomonadaceae bacterium]